uniref:Type I restriction enzyme, S subunit n=1 Tax=Candidatus Kentrum sp. DK TaxID=2126562 RepID=A0A450T3M3_9GAMM|nr:MAG: type I restriction enzyme, S subunit [Candidatus Kentron sp. DK]
MMMRFRPLQDLCSTNVERVNPAISPDDEFWYVDISSIDNTAKTIATPTRTKGKTASVRARQVIRSRDVLVSTTRPNLNSVAQVPHEYSGEICSTGFCVLRCGEELDSDYLFHFVRSGYFIDSLSNLVQGALYPAVTDKQVLAQSIPWLPIEHQRQIAARLKAQLAEVDKARRAAEAQLRDAAELHKAIRRTEFEMLLTKWKRQHCLKDICAISAGGTPSRGNKSFFEGNIPWVKTLDLNFSVIMDSEEKVSPEAFRSIRGEMLPVGTVLIAMYGGAGTIGKSGILGIEACTNQAVCAIQPVRGTLDSEFLHEWLCCIRSEWMQYSGGNRKDPNINKSIVEMMTIPWPPGNVQMDFIAKLREQLSEAIAIIDASKFQVSEIDLLPQKILAQAFDHPES